jgi:hypothetical protein
MGIRPEHVYRFGVVSALERMGGYHDSEAARQLLFCTAAHESAGFSALYQVPAGPAIGLCQMEPATFLDIRDRFLAGDSPWKVAMRDCIRSICGTDRPEPDEMAGNLVLAFVFCRLKYYTVHRHLPAPWDVVAQAAYWKSYYNTELGCGRPEDYIRAWETYCLPTLLKVKDQRRED